MSGSAPHTPHGWSPSVSECPPGHGKRGPQQAAPPFLHRCQGSHIKVCELNAQPSVTLLLLIIQLLQEVAFRALSPLHFKVFVLAGAVIWNSDWLGLFLGQRKACSAAGFRGRHCGSQTFLSRPTCSILSACKACVALCSQNNPLWLFFFCSRLEVFSPVREPEQKKPALTSQREHP